MKEFFTTIVCICIGACVPVYALWGAFHNIGSMTAWGWIGVTVISVAGMGIAIGIWAIFHGTKTEL
jgi:hypothetical protein